MKIKKIKEHYAFFSSMLLICVILLGAGGISFSDWTDEVSVNAEIKTGKMEVLFDNRERSKAIDIAKDGSFVIPFQYDSVVPFVIGKKVTKELEQSGYEIISCTENGQIADELFFPAKEDGRGSLEVRYTGGANPPPQMELRFEQYTGKEF